MPAGKFNDLGYLCLRHLVREHAANTHTMAMDMQHNLHGLIACLVKEALQNVNDEFHRGIIVIQKKHAVQAGFFRLLSCLRDDSGPGAVTLAGLMIAFVAHRMRIIHTEALSSLA